MEHAAEVMCSDSLGFEVDKRMIRRNAGFLCLQNLVLADFQQPLPGVHLWQNTWNVFVLKHEEQTPWLIL